MKKTEEPGTQGPKKKRKRPAGGNENKLKKCRQQESQKKKSAAGGSDKRALSQILKETGKTAGRSAESAGRGNCAGAKIGKDLHRFS